MSDALCARTSGQNMLEWRGGPLHGCNNLWSKPTLAKPTLAIVIRPTLANPTLAKPTLANVKVLVVCKDFGFSELIVWVF